jgi:hypothetical protein
MKSLRLRPEHPAVLVETLEHVDKDVVRDRV